MTAISDFTVLNFVDDLALAKISEYMEVGFSSGVQTQNLLSPPTLEI